jgi:hypothetical protein
MLKISQYERPTVANAAPTLKPDGTGPDNEGLPAGWVSSISKRSGRVYYWNATLQKSQYDRPTSEETTKLPIPGDDNEGLPPDWISMISRNTGKVYYFNTKTRVSQYDRPTEAGQPAYAG